MINRLVDGSVNILVDSMIALMTAMVVSGIFARLCQR